MLGLPKFKTLFRNNVQVTVAKIYVLMKEECLQMSYFFQNEYHFLAHFARGTTNFVSSIDG